MKRVKHKETQKVLFDIPIEFKPVDLVTICSGNSKTYKYKNSITFAMEGSGLAADVYLTTEDIFRLLKEMPLAEKRMTNIHMIVV